MQTSCYPSAVALARLLASPRWTRLTLDPADSAAFAAEVRRTVEPRYTWAPVPYWRYVEPLARTLLEEQDLREQMGRAESSCRPATSSMCEARPSNRTSRARVTDVPVGTLRDTGPPLRPGGIPPGLSLHLWCRGFKNQFDAARQGAVAYPARRSPRQGPGRPER